jgi:NADH-quinone oxidoreductase subunit G
MTRCIQCTRCIRFVDEVGGTPELGGIFRGEKMEITNYLGRALTSEMSGNLIDVCPVGALTNKPAAFTARSWEFTKTETIDAFDAIGANIRVDVRGNEVMRVLPRLNDDVNEEWINDKTRFAIDGLKRQRLDRPYIRENGKLRPAAWSEAFTFIAEKLRAAAPERIAALAGDMVDCESMFALKSLMHALGSNNIDCRQDGAEYDVSTRAGYVMNSGITGIEEADAILLIGTNPRHEGTLINARIRKRWLRGGCRVGMIGAPADLGYPHKHIGNTPQSLADLAGGKHEFAAILKNAKKPMFILGAGALARADGPALHRAGRELAEQFNAVREDWNGFNVLQLAASRVGGLDLGFLPQGQGKGTRDILGGKMEVVWLLGADEADLKNLKNTFVIYQGHHGDKGAHRADVILPGAAYTEKPGIYVNTEGRAQLALQAAFPPGEAREDWKIIRAFSEVFGAPLPFDNLSQLRERMFEHAPVLSHIGIREKMPMSAFGAPGPVSAQPFAPVIANFYMTDPISRASVTMAKCTEEILPLTGAEAAE